MTTAGFGTTEPRTKPLPWRVSVGAPSPAIAWAGLIVCRTGAGLLIVIVNALVAVEDVEPAGIWRRGMDSLVFLALRWANL